jgi:hypothetical protein
LFTRAEKGVESNQARNEDPPKRAKNPVMEMAFLVLDVRTENRLCQNRATGAVEVLFARFVRVVE